MGQDSSWSLDDEATHEHMDLLGCVVETSEEMVPGLIIYGEKVVWVGEEALPYVKYLRLSGDTLRVVVD